MTEAGGVASAGLDFGRLCGCGVVRLQAQSPAVSSRTQSRRRIIVPGGTRGA